MERARYHLRDLHFQYSLRYGATSSICIAMIQSHTMWKHDTFLSDFLGYEELSGTHQVIWLLARICLHLLVDQGHWRSTFAVNDLRRWTDKLGKLSLMTPHGAYNTMHRISRGNPRPRQASPVLNPRCHTISD